MQNRQSYIDALNAGRERRPASAYDQLDDTLSRLEERLDSLSKRNARTPVRGEPGSDSMPGESKGESRQEIARRLERLTAPGHRDESLGHASVGAQRPEHAAMPMPRGDVVPKKPDVQSDAVMRIGDKLKQLREELKGDMDSTLSREFEVMRRDIEKAYVAAANGRGDDGLADELERIAQAIALLAENNGEKGIAEVQSDLKTIKSAFSVIAREDTLRSQVDQWNDFSKRFQAIEQKLMSFSGPESGELKEIGSQLQQVAAAIENLPETLSLGALEGRVRTLSENLESFAGQTHSASAKTFGMLEQRLDEISRAIANPSVAKIDNEPLERMEARISALCEQVETFSQSRDVSEIGERIAALSAQIDEFASADTSADKIVEILGDRLSTIAEKIEAVPSGDMLVQVIGERIDNLAQQFSASEKQAPDNEILQGLQDRLDEIVSRLDQSSAPVAAPDTGMLQNLESQLNDISRHLSESAKTPIGDIGPRLEAIESSLAKTRENLEAQLTELTVHMSAFPEGGDYPKDLLPRLASLEASLEKARENLESQLAEVSGYLSSQPAGSKVDADLPERLAKIESSLERTHETVLDVARLAAQEALNTVPGEGRDDAFFNELTLDLKDLEQLTRKSEERNARTFEAIHDTLLKIVDHLGELEAGSFASSRAEPQYQPMAETPSLDDGIGEPLDEPVGSGDFVETDDLYEPDDSQETDHNDGPARMSPAEAAAAAAAAALENRRGPARENKSEKSRKSMFGGISRAFSSSKPEPSENTDRDDDYVVMDDEPVAPAAEDVGSDLQDSPLEPGSGAPDLSAIMSRVREENQALAAGGNSSAAQSDFIAAARRAAQAAAAEADLQKRKTISDVDNSGRFAFGKLLGKNRKALMMGVAAILVLAGAYQLGSIFLKGGNDMGQDVAANAVEPEPAGQADEQIASGTAIGTGSPASADGADTMAGNPKPGSPDDATPATDGPLKIASASEAHENAGLTDNTSTAATGSARSEDIKLPAPTMTLPPLQSPAAAVGSAATGQQTASRSKDAGAGEQQKPNLEMAPENTSLPDSIGPVALRTAVERGDPKAMFEVATLYSEGKGVPADPVEAAKWYKQAATLGLAIAQYRYGSILEKGTGIKRDLNEAVDWYQKAAQQGNASAMHNLAVLFAMGAVGPADNDAAVRWFRKAADYGVTDSQFNLGVMAAKGAGMPRNLEESYKWFALAAKTGDKDAAQKRDEVAKALSAGDLAKARATVELWKAKTPDAESNSVQIPDAWTGTAAETASVDMKKAIRNIQILLANHGYNPGTADGIMGERTKNAIAAYQKDNGLAATGEIDEALVRKLLGKNG